MGIVYHVGGRAYIARSKNGRRAVMAVLTFLWPQVIALWVVIVLSESLEDKQWKLI